MAPLLHRAAIISQGVFELQRSKNWVLPLTWLVALTTVQHYRADCYDKSWQLGARPSRSKVKVEVTGDKKRKSAAFRSVVVFGDAVLRQFYAGGKISACCPVPLLSCASNSVSWVRVSRV